MGEQRCGRLWKGGSPPIPPPRAETPPNTFGTTREFALSRREKRYVLRGGAIAFALKRYVLRCSRSRSARKARNIITTAPQQHLNGLSTACRQRLNSITTAPQQHLNGLSTAYRPRLNRITTTPQQHLNDLSTACRPLCAFVWEPKLEIVFV